MSSVQGAAEFRNRLAALASVGEGIGQDWGDNAVRLLRSRIRHVTGATAASVRVGEVSNSGATLVGSKVVDYLADGTRAHVEVPRNAQALRFQVGGQTVFSKRVYHPATAGDPKIREAPEEALEAVNFDDRVVNAWNGAA